MQQVIPRRTPVAALAQPAIQNKQELYKNMKTRFSRALIGLGSVQLCIGVLCIIFQCVSLVFFSTVFSLAPVAHGIWNGLLFFITGIFGIVGGCRKSRCEVVSFNVLSIISACFATALLGIATPSAILAECCPELSSGSSGTATTSGDPSFRKQVNVVIAMESMLAILAVIEAVVAIVSSAVCCAIGACCCGCGGCCCCPKTPSPQAQLMTLEHTPQQHVHQQSSNQWVLAQNQPYHQLNVHASDASSRHLYTSLQNTEYDDVISPRNPAISNNSAYLEIIDDSSYLEIIDSSSYLEII